MVAEHPFQDAFPDPNAEKEKDLQAEIERRRYEKIMATKDGRWVMWRILMQCGTFYPALHPHETGAQAAGMAIRDTLRATNLELYHAMIVENDK